MNLNPGVRSCLALLLLVIATALFSAPSPLQAADIESELSEARQVFLQGVDGDKHAVRDATNRFRSLSLNYPKEPVFVAYFGACMTLQGRDAPNGINKQRLTEEGLGKIDFALQQLADDKNMPSIRRLDIKLVAANSFIYIPSFFNRYDRGKRLLKEILEDPDFNKMAPGFKSASYFAAAMVAQGDGNKSEQRQYLELAVSTDPQGRNAQFASKMLEEQAK
jgi:hypothetical protein